MTMPEKFLARHTTASLRALLDDKKFPYLPYEIACAELCGFGHFRMFGRLYVMPRADVDQWLAEQ